MSYGYDRYKLSLCAATFLNVSPFFNNGTTLPNGSSSTIDMLTPSTYPLNAENWEMRFRIGDPDGIYQVQLEQAIAGEPSGLSACSMPEWTENMTFQFSLPVGATRIEKNHIWIRVVDMNGDVEVKAWDLQASKSPETSQKQGIQEGRTSVTLSHKHPNSLTPINSRTQWAGWLGHFWEKTPDSKVSNQPPYYLNHPYTNLWDHWFYAHAKSKLVYDISDKDYTRFEGLFYIAHPCKGLLASMEVIGIADGIEIYNSGVIKAAVLKEENRHDISFQIPKGSKELIIRVTDAGDGTCDHFVLGNTYLFYNTEPMIPTTQTHTEPNTNINSDGTNTDRTETYLTLTYDAPDALVPTNPRTEWKQKQLPWENRITWEKTPDGRVPRKPNGFMSPDPHIPFMDEWNYWFYAHAVSRIVYDLSSGNYTKFDAYFDMPNPCGSVASVEVICLADGIEIYNSGVLRGAQTRNTKISFDIPAGTETFTINVTDAGDGDGCDHFIFANARLMHGDLLPRKVDPTGPGLSFSTTTTNVRVGGTFTLHLNSEKVTDLAGWQFGIVFDPAVLEALEVSEGDFLKRQGGTTFFRQGRIDNAAGKITGLSSALISEKGVSGTGTLLSVTFAAKAVGETQVTLQDLEFGSIDGKVIPIVPDEIVINVRDQPAWDVNQDGRISILDLILVARRLGETASASSEVDVNADGVISILDLIMIAQHLGESTAAAPSTVAIDSVEGLNPAILQAWIERAHIEADGSITFQQGVASLQRLLESLVPKKTTLLANYPNPFNPETWIPYQLAEPAEVSIRIYTADGKLVRTLELGHQSAGIYESRSQAAQWDGRNEVGESVASGLYFYTFTAGKFVATRRMLIRK